MAGGKQKLGKWGESVAAVHLEAKGYEILARNWRCSKGEIDLVAQAGQELVFVEVKTRKGRDTGTPEEGLTYQKGKKLMELALLYLAEYDLEADWRVDLVAVELDRDGKFLRCEHIPNAVLGW
jgi:putative endonuclease